VRESEKVEGLWRTLKSPNLPVGGRIATELDQTGLLGMQFERELSQSLVKVLEELHCVGVVLEPEGVLS
jgi:hypothetical protein